MKVIIVTGPSGVGKSQTILPGLTRRLNGFQCDTGDLFKAWAGWLMYIGEFANHNPPKTISLGDDALLEFYNSGRYHDGLEHYERLKQLGEFTGNEIIEFIESIRCLCPDLPSKAVRKLHELVAPNKILITTAINQREFEFLVSMYFLYFGYNIIHIKLNCLEELKNRIGDNRHPVGGHTKIKSLELTYDWISVEDKLDNTAEFIKGYFNYE
jgi:hypothetical protein